MANICGIQHGAGEGNRTPVVSLGSLRINGFLPFSHKFHAAHLRNEAGFEAEHSPSLPQLYRTEFGPETALARCRGLTTNAKDCAHGLR